MFKKGSIVSPHSHAFTNTGAYFACNNVLLVFLFTPVVIASDGNSTCIIHGVFYTCT